MAGYLVPSGGRRLDADSCATGPGSFRREIFSHSANPCHEWLLVVSAEKNHPRGPRALFKLGVFPALLGIAVVVLSLERSNLRLSVLTLVLYWIACFILGFGMRAARKAAFPLVFLFLMVPLPVSLMDSAVVVLQRGSANAAYGLFKLAGVPVYRQGFQFSLPGVDIKVAEECSGIRSCIALFITSLLAAHLFLRSNWNKLFLGLVAIPIAIFKNAVRIFTISWLGVYVDSNFLYGRLHRYGGLPFSIFALALMLPLLFAFYKWEARHADPRYSGLR